MRRPTERHDRQTLAMFQRVIRGQELAETIIVAEAAVDRAIEELTVRGEAAFGVKSRARAVAEGGLDLNRFAREIICAVRRWVGHRDLDAETIPVRSTIKARVLNGNAARVERVFAP